MNDNEQSSILLPDGTRASALTSSQRLLWTGQKMHPHAPLYNMALAFEIEGEIDSDRFRDAWRRLVNACSILRTIIIDVDGTPYQSHTGPAPVLDVLDLSSSDDVERESASLLSARSVRMFDLGELLTDTALLKLSSNRYVWFLNQHHLVTDAVSSQILFRNLQRAYSDPFWPDAGDIPVYSSYVDFEQHHRRSTLYEKAMNYWRRVQSDTPPHVSLYGRAPRYDDTHTRRIRRTIDTELSTRLVDVATRLSANALTANVARFNLFMTVLAAYLYRVSGQSSFKVGAPSHNRPTAVFKETPGVFIEVLPFRIDVAETDTFRALFGKVSKETSRFLRFAQPGVSHAALARSFNVVLNYLTVSFPEFASHPVSTKWVHCDHGDSAHHLRLQVHDFGNEARFELGFDLAFALFDEDSGDKAADHFLNLLDGFVSQPDRLVVRTPLVVYGAAESGPVAGQEDQLRRREETGADGGTVCQEIFRQFADATTRIAIRGHDVDLSYGDLSAAVHDLTIRLRELGVGSGDRVGIYIGRSPEFIVATIAVLAAGAAYVPVDPSDPADRTRFILRDSGVKAILVASGDDAPPVDTVACLRVNLLLDPVPVDDIRSTANLPTAEDTAYVIYTSGSTGQPKGVRISHRALSFYLRRARSLYAPGHAAVMPLFTSPSFDLTITSIFLPLVTGGTVVIFEPERSGPDLSLRRVVRDDSLTIIKLTPSHLVTLETTPSSSKSLRALIFGGEDLRTDIADRAMNIFGPEVTIYNEYGPTEATVGCIVHRYNAETDRGPSVPIGEPVEGCRAYLLDEGLNPVPDGVIGELYLAGPGLADGYHNRPEETRARFVADPFRTGETAYRTGDSARRDKDGRLTYLGRKDDQLKIRGFRVERGEVEAALTQHPKVRDCAVDAVEPPSLVSPNSVRYCVRCGLSSEYPRISFDSEGVCNTCRDFEGYRQQAMEYFGTLDELESILKQERQRKTGPYDCLVLFSGGKDSTYALYRVKAMGLKPLAFTLDNGFISDNAKSNIARVVENLGVDHLYGRTPAMNEIFVESLKRHANVCNGCFKTIYTLGLKTAREHGIPVIVTGLSRGQLFETRLTGELFSGDAVDVAAIERTVLEARKAYHRIDDAVAHLVNFEDVRDDDLFEEIHFVDFYRYCDTPLNEIMSFLEDKAPWVRPTDTGRSTNCLINESGIFVHRKKTGYHNYAWPYSWDVRMGHKTRSEAIAELEDEIDEGRVMEQLDRIGFPVRELTEEPRLTAYYVASESIPSSEMRSHLSRYLPDYMMPSLFRQIDSIPRSSSGKVDRSLLRTTRRALRETATAYIPPRTESERRMSQIWSDCLAVAAVGMVDNFFDLGGDSIRAIRIVSKARSAGFQLEPADLFNNQTIESLSKVWTLIDPSEQTIEDESDTSENFVSLGTDQLDRVAEMLRRADQKGQDR